MSGYRVEIAGGNSLVVRSADSDTRTTVSGLVNGTLYSVRIAAVNVAGVGSWSEAVQVRPTAPPVTVPLQVKAVRSGSTIQVSWSRPAQGDVRRYIIRSSRGGKPPKVIGYATKTSFVFSAKGVVRVQVAAGASCS